MAIAGALSERLAYDVRPVAVYRLVQRLERPLPVCSPAGAQYVLTAEALDLWVPGERAERLTRAARSARLHLGRQRSLRVRRKKARMRAAAKAAERAAAREDGR